MEMTLGLSLGVVFAGNVKHNLWPFIGAAVVVMAIAIVLTRSRGGVIGLVSRWLRSLCLRLTDEAKYAIS